MSKILPQLLNKKQLANYLGVCLDTVDRMVKDGSIPERTSGVYWHRESVDEALRDGGVRRMMNQRQLCTYLGVTAPTVNKWVANGVLPPKVTGTNYWDRRAVDAWLNRWSGLAAEAALAGRPEKTIYQRHKEGRCGISDAAQQRAE